jgi:hypothetical protein
MSLSENRCETRLFPGLAPGLCNATRQSAMRTASATFAYLAACAAALLAFSAAAVAAPALATKNVNMRQGPGTSYPIVTTIPGGSTVEVSGCHGEWCTVTGRARPAIRSPRASTRAPAQRPAARRRPAPKLPPRRPACRRAKRHLPERRCLPAPYRRSRRRPPPTCRFASPRRAHRRQAITRRLATTRLQVTTPTVRITAHTATITGRTGAARGGENIGEPWVIGGRRTLVCGLLNQSHTRSVSC